MSSPTPHVIPSESEAVWLEPPQSVFYQALPGSLKYASKARNSFRSSMFSTRNNLGECFLWEFSFGLLRTENAPASLSGRITALACSSWIRNETTVIMNAKLLHLIQNTKSLNRLAVAVRFPDASFCFHKMFIPLYFHLVLNYRGKVLERSC